MYTANSLVCDAVLHGNIIITAYTSNQQQRRVNIYKYIILHVRIVPMSLLTEFCFSILFLLLLLLFITISIIMSVEQTMSSSNNGSTTPNTISVVAGGKAGVLMMVSVLDVDISLSAKAEIMIFIITTSCT